MPDLDRRFNVRSRRRMGVFAFDDALDEGRVINVLVVDNRVRFEVSLEAGARNALGLSSRLPGVAYRVRDH